MSLAKKENSKDMSSHRTHHILYEDLCM